MIVNTSTLKEYEIITLIYNRKACKLESLRFSLSEDIIFQGVRPCITKFRVWYKHGEMRIGQPDQLIQFICFFILILLIAHSTLKEYEIITLIYNRKTC